MSIRRAVYAAAFAIAVLGVGVIGANGAGWYRTHDFYVLYSGARIVVEGGDPYDEVRWCAGTEHTTPDAFDPKRDIAVCFQRYAYPLWTAVLLAPLGALPLEAASSLWLAIGIALVIGALRWSWLAVGGVASWAPAFALVVLFSEPFWLQLTLGQMSAVLFAVAAFTTYALASRHDRAGGAALAVAALKPNVLPFHAAALLAFAATRRRAGYVVAGLTAGSALALVSLAVRPDWIASWWREVFGRQIGHSVEYATAWGLAAVDFHQPAIAPLLIAALVVFVALVARERLGDPVALSALAIPISLFATPYAWSYDQLTMAVTWGFVLAAAAHAAVPQRRLLLGLVLLVAIALPWVCWAIAPMRRTESLTALVPAATAVLAAFATRVAARPA